MELATIIAENVARLRVAIADCCREHGRDPHTIRVMAVTKNQDPAALEGLRAAGIADYGENRAPHLRQMVDCAPAQSRFHFIGRLQSRQLKDIVPLVTSFHSLDQAHHAERLQRLCREHQRHLQVFIQVNTAGERQKGGVDAAQLPALIDLVQASPHLELMGLMAMAPDLGLDAHDQDDVRRCFAATRALAERYGLPRLSMGMSGDWRLAIAEGSTDLRIGTSLFCEDGV